MAMDSIDKVRSVPRYFPGLPGMTRGGPKRDGTLDAGDVIEVAGFYRGVTPGLPPVILPSKRCGFLLRIYNNG